MKKNEVQVGCYYRTKVSGNMTIVRVDSVEKREARPPYIKRSSTYWCCTNMTTQRQIVIKSATRLRDMNMTPNTICDNCGGTAVDFVCQSCRNYVF